MKKHFDRKWFREYWVDRKGLPLELSIPIDTDKTDDLQEILKPSILHIDRFLTFRELYNDGGGGDLDQFWFDTVIRIEDTSYYAAMSMPYLRQVIEFETNYAFDIRDNFKSTELDDKWSKFVQAYPKPNRVVLVEALVLAHNMNKLSEEYYSIVNKKQLASVYISLYVACADLLKLSCRVIIIKEVGSE